MEDDKLETTEKKPRGFAAMSPERRREVASRGGRKAQANGTANRFNAESASEAGKKAAAGGKGHRFTPDEARRASRISAAVRTARSGCNVGP